MDVLAPVLSGVLAAGAAAGIAQYAKDRARSHQWEREEIQLDLQAHMAEMEAKVARHVHLTAAVRLEVERITKELNTLRPPGPAGALRRSVGGPVRGIGLVRLEPGEKFLAPPQKKLTGVTGEESAVSLKAALGGCPHQQAETVELCTGEVVACVCIACLDRLPANWIDQQRDRAEREARCDHRALMARLRMGVGVALHPKVCGECGASVLYP